MDRFDVALGLALFVTVALTGQLVRLFSSAGYETLSVAVWPIGYGGAVLVAWYVWIRPLDLRSPASEDGVWERDRPSDDAPDSDGRSGN